MASDDLSIPPEVRRELRQATVRAAGEVIAEAVAEGMTDALANALARNLTRRGVEGPWLVWPSGAWKVVDDGSLLGEHERFREHSVKLNSVMWALWQAWHPELAREDHCDVDVDAVLDDTLNAVIAVRGERAAIISHALRSCQLFDGPGSCADYDEAAAIVAALGFPLEGHVNGGELDDEPELGHVHVVDDGPRSALFFPFADGRCTWSRCMTPEGTPTPCPEGVPPA